MRVSRQIIAWLLTAASSVASVSGAPPLPGPPHLVLDIRPGAPSSAPSNFWATHDAAVFLVRSQLWRTDGTAAGTFPLSPLGGFATSGMSGGFVLAATLQRLFFLGKSDENDKQQLWVTDGSLAGTFSLTQGLVFDRAASAWPLALYVSSKGVLFFEARDQQRNEQLWLSDGRPDGARLVRSFGSASTHLGGLMEYRGDVYFTVRQEGAASLQLWKSDGMQSGTVPLTDPSTVDFAKAVFMDSLYFTAKLGGQFGLWRSAGRPGDIHLVSPIAGLAGMIAGRDRMFLFHHDETSGSELWSSDGTPSGIKVLTHFDDPEPFQTLLGPVVTAQGRLVFAARDTQTGGEVWVSDGTLEGTRSLDVCPGACWASQPSLPPLVYQQNGFTFFTVNDGVHGPEPWTTDGTAAGSFMLADICPGACGSYGAVTARLGNLVLLLAEDDQNGYQVWAYEGVPGHANRLSDMPHWDWLSDPGVVLGSQWLFAGDDGLHGKELLAVDIPTACVGGPTALCLQGGRFQVEATYRTPTGHEGMATAVSLTADTGYFWFFNPENVEVVAKVIDACSFPGAPRFWVFASGLTSVAVNLRVTDTATGSSRLYQNPLGAPFQPVQDTAAFSTCAGSP